MVEAARVVVNVKACRLVVAVIVEAASAGAEKREISL